MPVKHSRKALPGRRPNLRISGQDNRPSNGLDTRCSNSGLLGNIYGKNQGGRRGSIRDGSHNQGCVIDELDVESDKENHQSGEKPRRYRPEVLEVSLLAPNIYIAF